VCVCVCVRLCACLCVCDSESLWLCECDCKQLFICIMFKSTMGLYRPFVISLIILIFILLNSLAFYPLHLYFSPFLGVALIGRGQGNFFHIFLVFMLWFATWIPVFGGVFHSPAEFQFKYSKWSDKSLSWQGWCEVPHHWPREIGSVEKSHILVCCTGLYSRFHWETGLL
jgi:hypothetical protein